MAFKFTIKRTPLELEFEVVSIAEGVSLLQEQDTAIRAMASVADQLNGETALTSGTVETADASATADRRRPGRPARNKPDPATANSPPPAPIPDASVQDGLNPPPFLDRSNPANVVTGDGSAAPAQAAPPPPPPAPSIVPPSGILAGKIIAELDRRKAGSADGGQTLADWLATSGLVNKGSSYAESVDVVRLNGDEKLRPIATALGVA